MSAVCVGGEGVRSRRIGSKGIAGADAHPKKSEKSPLLLLIGDA